MVAGQRRQQPNPFPHQMNPSFVAFTGAKAPRGRASGGRSSLVSFQNFQRIRIKADIFYRSQRTHARCGKLCGKNFDELSRLSLGAAIPVLFKEFSAGDHCSPQKFFPLNSTRNALFLFISSMGKGKISSVRTIRVHNWRKEYTTASVRGLHKRLSPGVRQYVKRGTRGIAL